MRREREKVKIVDRQEVKPVGSICAHACVYVRGSSDVSNW